MSTGRNAIVQVGRSREGSSIAVGVMENPRVPRTIRLAPAGGPAHEVSAHAWLRLAVGRICSRCMVAQARDEFSDELPCIGNRMWELRD